MPLSSPSSASTDTLNMWARPAGVWSRWVRKVVAGLVSMTLLQISRTSLTGLKTAQHQAQGGLLSTTDLSERQRRTPSQHGSGQLHLLQHLGRGLDVDVVGEHALLYAERQHGDHLRQA